MATSATSKARSGSRPPSRRSGGRSGAKGTTGRTKGASRAAAKAPAKGRAAPAGPPVTRRMAATTSAAIDGHRHDVLGLVLLALGLLVASGVYADVAGAVGRGVDTAAGAAVGWAKLALPPVLAGAGIGLLRGPRRRPAPAPDGAADAGVDPGLALDRRAGVLVGSVLLGVAGAGLLHLLGGRPGLDDGVEALGEAGGALGLAAGGPLAAVAATWGAALVLVTEALLGLVLCTGTSVRTAVGGVARPVGGVVRRAFGGLSTLSGSRDGEVSEPALSVYDQGDEPDDQMPVLDPDPEPEPAPRRRRAPKVAVPGGDAPDAEQLAIELGPAAAGSPWKLPSLSLLHRSAAQEVDRRAVEARGRVLEAALAEHGVETRLAGMVVGPTITRYELELAPGVKVARLTSLHRDIAYAMASADVRILAPIPGKQAIGVEVPNEVRQLVAVGDILSSPEARRATHPLEVAMGRDITGASVMMNLATMPHVLIAGQTGAGKSSGLNSIITSILMRSTPDQVRMILIDPKQVEMGQYDRLPHLLTSVVTEPKKAANALAWAVREMERRYDLLRECGFRDITGYNAAHDRGELQPGPTDHLGLPEGEEAPSFPRLPFILIVVDELADLMMVAARDVEESICRIAQKARAVGIHLVVATQRPSVNVITGLIKANVPARVAFAVSSATDSRVVLDQQGAEKLVGKGDMLLLEGGTSTTKRVQGCWVTEEEVRAVCAAWRRQAPEPGYEDTAVQGGDEAANGSFGVAGSGAPGAAADDDDERLIAQATELVVRSQLGSTSMLQRKLKIGFARAGRVMDMLEERGVVGPSEGSKARAVLMAVEELEGTATPAE